MATDKGASELSRSPEHEAQKVHDAVFDELVHQVAAELPKLEEEGEAKLPVPVPKFPVRRSGIYTRWIGPPVQPKEPRVEDALIESPLAEKAEFETAFVESEVTLESMRSGGRPSGITEEVRVDVDGLFPTMTISGTIYRLFGGRLTWIARVKLDPTTGDYVGPISYRDGVSSLEPRTNIRCKLTGSWWQQASMRAHVTFSGGGLPERNQLYRYDRANFREVGIEYDYVQGSKPITSYDLHAHPTRPTDLPSGRVSIEDIFTRQGLRMTRTTSTNMIPTSEAGANMRWSDLEMHDAMQRHWSKFKDLSQWQVWTLFAGLHEMGPNLGGIMFDDIGKAQRQGCAVFMDSFIAKPPPSSDPAPSAFVERMCFWTAVHEIGHTFNLAHSWQKALGTPWVPLVPEPEARSYMNYPYNVAGGSNAFFKNFYHRFSDNELLFLRHAPERFVQQGNAPWFDHHGFEQARRNSSTALELSLRFNRSSTQFQALEPVVAEVKLKNTSPVPVVVDKSTLRSEELMIVIGKQGKEFRQWFPYQSYCTLAEPYILEPGQSIYASLFLSAGLNGFDLAEPGRYRIYAALRTPAGDVLSAPREIKIAPYGSREQEFLADEVYDDEVARVLAFGGSRVLDQACATLQEIVNRMPDSRIAMHAAAALGRVAASPGMVLDEIAGKPQFVVRGARPKQAQPLLGIAYGDLDAAADTFGHIRLTEEVSRTAVAMATEGERRFGAEMTGRLAETLANRGVLPRVVSEVRKTSQSLSK